MNQNEKREFLIKCLLKEHPDYAQIQMPSDIDEQKTLLRSLMNIRMPEDIDEAFLSIQDEYLGQVNAEKGIVTIDDMQEVQRDIYIWKGDITRIKAGAIVNAANSGMTGCYQPCHNCIDNCIHTYAGIQLRNYCSRLMKQQGHKESTGTAKITPAFNLPCDYVIHTVGPIVDGVLTQKHCRQLASCYRSCIELADGNDLESIAFCCISTGVFMFPNEQAAQIAVQTVKAYKEETGSRIKAIFNVFKEMDEQLYYELLK